MSRRIIAGALAGLIIAGTAAAQGAGTQERVKLWGSIGAGGSVPTSGGDAITNILQVSGQKGKHYGALRVLLLHDIDRHTDEIGEIGPLYGGRREYSWGHATFATGFSWLGFYKCPDDPEECSTLGIPVVAEASKSLSFAGIGIQAFANLNGTASHAGAVLFLQLGRLR